MIDLKRITIPVFLVYAGIIHAIGLTLLLPMIVTLPGPGAMIAPEAGSASVESDAAALRDRDVTSALSAPKPPQKDAGSDASSPPEPDIAAGAPGNIANLLPPSTATERDRASSQANVAALPGKAKAVNAKPVKSGKKPVAHRSGRPSARRASKKDTKIAPFGGGMSGLFSPGAPPKRR